MTVADLEPRLTMREILSWQEFERDFGPITLHERMDAAMMMIAYTVHASAGGQLPPERFLPTWHEEPIGDTVEWLKAMAS